MISNRNFVTALPEFMGKISAFATLICVLIVTQGQVHVYSQECIRMLVGSSGIVSSYNYPFDYANDLSCDYVHYFTEFKDVRVDEICFHFTRFDLEDCDEEYLEINDEKFCKRGSESMDNLCFPVLDKPFQMKFKTNHKVVHSGFYANYTVIWSEFTTALPGEENNETLSGEFCYGYHQFLCASGECILKNQTCDDLEDCDDGSDETYAHARCKGSAGQKSGFRACDFTYEQSGLNYPTLRRCNMDIWAGSWTVEMQSWYDDYGPKAPHNPGNGLSYFVQTKFENNYKAVNLSFEIDDDLYKDNIPYCLTFWYHMFGKDTGRLNVIWGSGRPDQAIWTRVGNLQDQWYKAEIERFPSDSDGDMILFNAIRGGQTKAQIALDDISLMPGPCHPNADFDLADDISCTFESGFCRWADATYWIITDTVYQDSFLGPPGAAQGRFYLKPKGVSNVLMSPLITCFHTGSRCLIFSAFTKNAKDVINVEVRYSFDQNYPVEQFDIWRQSKWQMFKIDVSCKSSHKIVLNSLYEQTFFDDIAYIDSSCNYLDYGKCDFEQYRCDANSIGDHSCIANRQKCDGNPDCPLKEDEDNCEECKLGAFHCDNDQCVPESYRCDGFRQCGDGSDEHNCPGNPNEYQFHFPLAATICIIIALSIVLGLITLKLVTFMYNRRAQQRHARALAMRDYIRNNAGGNTDEHLAVPPPDYNDVVVNPPFLSSDDTEFIGLHEDKDDLPSYDVVSHGNFVQITVPVEEEIKKMKQEMASRMHPSGSGAWSMNDCDDTSSSNTWSTGEDTSDHQSSSSQSSNTTEHNSANRAYLNPCYERDDSVI